MGYCHYWSRERTIGTKAFRFILQDFQKILLPLDDLGVRLAGPLGTGLPELTSEEVALNGLAACGHPVNEEISIPFPDPDASGIGDSSSAIVDSYHGMGVLLRHRSCNGDCSFETFCFKRTVSGQPTENGLYADSCKTGFRPYDLAVQCFLLIAKHHLRDRIGVYSGGADAHWSDARKLCYLHLGYPLLEFRLDSDAGLTTTADH